MAEELTKLSGDLDSYMKQKESKIKYISPEKIDIDRVKLGMPRIEHQQFGDVKIDFTDLKNTLDNLISEQFLTDENLLKLGFNKVLMMNDNNNYFWELEIKNDIPEALEYLVLSSNSTYDCQDGHFTVELIDSCLGNCKTVNDVKELISVLTKYL